MSVVAALAALAVETQASSARVGHPANLALDGNPATYWEPEEGEPAWLELRYEGLVHVTSLRLSWWEGKAPPVALSASVDGKTWRPVPMGDAVGQYFRLGVRPGWSSRVALTEIAVTAERAAKADAVNVFMGTSNEGSHYSHGNQYPALHTPFGMSAWSVGTASLQDPWFYDFKDAAITGVKLTHQPTVWGGDFGAFDLMPMTGGPSADYAARRSPYQRENEVARPYYYRTVLDRYGITLELSPSERGAIFRFVYPADEAPFLAIGGTGARAGGVVRVDSRTLQGSMENGGVTVYFRAEFDRGIRAVTTGPGLAAGVEFEPGEAGTETKVVMKLATSYISFEQAHDNLVLELDGHTLETLTAETKAKWERALGRVEVAGGSAEAEMTFYSALYRVLAFPKMHWEPIGRDPATAQYLSPYDGQVHRNKKLWTGNGLWDTYRGVWPLFTILFPEQTGEMLDGLVNSYKDGGWTVRWSKPGYWECMIGTHADIIFADAFVKGIRNWDFASGYEASLKDALVAGGHDGKGRRFLERSAFLGYVPWTGLSPDDEVGARTIEDAINDFGISRFAGALGKTADQAYFQNRALAYANLWSPSVRQFRGKDAEGRWRSSDAAFDPFAWRYEWTEGNAWQYRAAPMHDGAGLAGLFGGRAKLEQGLDEILAASPRFEVGGYGTVIHEMLEAQAAGERGFGQFAVANEPVHHLLHMYAYAGRPSKTQYWVRRALGELFESGFANGHGYPGDEDEGQMSAWYVMNAMGFYSAAPGYAEYVMASPLFRSVTIHHDDGHDFHIEAVGDDADHPYIARATLDGQRYDRPYLTHAALMGGGQLVLTMSDKPESWGERAEDMPSSLTRLGETPRYVPNLSHGATITGSGENAPAETLRALLDNDSATKWLTFSPQGAFEVRLGTSVAVDCYTMTSAGDAPQRDPRSWRLSGSDDGTNWTPLDEKSAVTWANRLETKIFYLNNQARFAVYRVQITANAGAPELQLAEFELRQLHPARNDAR